MSKRISSRSSSSPQNTQSTSNPSSGALALGAGTGLVSGAGGSTFMSCPPQDMSFYCKFMRFIGIIKGIVFLIVLVVVLYFLWQWFRGTK
jgi:hypothetical protein